MDAVFLKQLLGYSALFNIIILFIWFIMLVVSKEWIFNLHAKMFGIPVESVAKIHFAAMAFYKLSIYCFFAIPFLVLHFMM